MRTPGIAPERKLMRTAAKQYSAFSRRQTLQAGMTDAQIRSRLERGLWVQLHRGVYISADVPITWQQRVMAACLACGPDAVASFASATMIWSLSSTLDVPHITVRGNAQATRPGIVVHRADRLLVATEKRFRVTTPLQTVLDMAAVLPEEQLERMLDEVHRRQLVDLRRLAEHLRDPVNRNRRGSRALREMLEVRYADRPIDSHLESLLFHALRKLGLPLPVPQYEVETRSGLRYIDYAYPDQRLAIEMDGFAGHSTPAAMDRDRARQNELEELDFRFRRFTWNMVRRDAFDVGITIGRGLDLVPTRWGPRR